MTPDLKRAERKLYDEPTAEHLHAAAQLSTGTASKYLSDDIVQKLELAYVAEWLARIARRDNPAAHAQIAADAVDLVFSWWYDRV